MKFTIPTDGFFMCAGVIKGTDFVLFDNILVIAHEILSRFAYAQKTNLNDTADVISVALCQNFG